MTTTATHDNPLVESWLTRSRTLGHHPAVNYDTWRGTYYTAACWACKATMSIRITQTAGGITTGYSARGPAYKRQCIGSLAMEPAVAAMTDVTRSA